MSEKINEIRNEIRDKLYYHNDTGYISYLEQEIDRLNAVIANNNQGWEKKPETKGR